MFNTKYNVKPSKGEVNSGEIVTTTAGYVDPHRQIKSMIEAGVRLNTYREQFDFNADEEVPDEYIDYSREPNFDLADASILLNSIKPIEKIEAETIAESEKIETEA